MRRTWMWQRRRRRRVKVNEVIKVGGKRENTNGESIVKCPQYYWQ